jgi:hypothetical protein
VDSRRFLRPAFWDRTASRTRMSRASSIIRSSPQMNHRCRSCAQTGPLTFMSGVPVGEWAIWAWARPRQTSYRPSWCSLRRYHRDLVEHHHTERLHQGIGGQPIRNLGPTTDNGTDGKANCRSR